MADYYPLIARAIAGLEKNTGEARRALYERARTALVAQLRGVSPALEESEITRERLALEEAIRKVEAEAARRARSEGGNPPFAQGPAPGASAPPAPPFPQSPPPSPQRAAPGERPDAKRPDPRIEALRADLGRAGLPQRPPSSGGAAAAAAAKPQSRPAMAPNEDVLKFRDKPGNSPPAPAPAMPPSPTRKPPPRDPFADIPPSHDFDQLESRIQQPIEPESLRPKRRDASLVESMDDMDDPSPLSRARSRPLAEEQDDERPPLRRAPGSYGGLIKAVIAGILILAIAGVLYWQRGAIVGLYQALRGQPSQVAQTPRETKAPATGPKISDRIGPGGAADQARQQVPAVAQRVVLYEEEPSDPQGKRFVGSAVWRTETVPGAAGQPPELAVRADVEIPERRLTMRFSIRRNADQTLPASHTIEIMFNLPADFPAGGISNVPGILMKQAEQTRGTPLAGLAVKVTNNFFLIGLSAVESDLQRNIQLLKERSWFDIPVVYNNNRRAILAIEKGTPGERAFAEAFAAWRQ